MFEVETAQIALENQHDCGCIQATKEDVDTIIDLFEVQLQKENSTSYWI